MSGKTGDKEKSGADKPSVKPIRRQSGALYVALLTSGVILLGSALEQFYMWKVTARLGVAVLASAWILFSAGEPKRAAFPLGILWIATALTFLY